MTRIITGPQACTGGWTGYTIRLREPAGRRHWRYVKVRDDEIRMLDGRNRMRTLGRGGWMYKRIRAALAPA